MQLHKYFQEDCRYHSDCFRRLIYTHWTTSHSNIMTQDQYSKNAPHFRSTLSFRRVFYLQRPQYQYLVNTSHVDQNFRKVQSYPKGAPSQILSSYEL